jgi:hypothetical protein
MRIANWKHVAIICDVGDTPRKRLPLLLQAPIFHCAQSRLKPYFVLLVEILAFWETMSHDNVAVNRRKAGPPE